MEDYTRNDEGIPKKNRMFVLGQIMAEFNERKWFFLMFVFAGILIGFVVGGLIGFIMGKVI
jgi:hypothetical protein